MATAPSHKSDETPSRVRRSPGERWWHAAVEPIFLVSGQRRLLYANPAWEKLTGAAVTEARGRVCRRRSTASIVEPLEQVLSLMAPPQDAMQGRPCRVRRRVPGKRVVWWEIDYLPWSDAEGVSGILGKLRSIEESGPAHAALPEKLVQLRVRANQAYRLESWQSDVPAVQRLVAQMRLAAQTHLPAVIQGLPGSGKESAARTIHQLSDRRETFFATFDTRLPSAALADLLASCQVWQIGTMYVKDLERLPRDAQALLLQRLHNDWAACELRLLAGTSANLDEETRAGRLLPELNARLTALTIQVPALSERLNDQSQSLDQMLPRAAEAAERSVRGISAAARERLRQHAWPGNLAELYEVLVQACGRAKGEQVQADDLPFYMRGAPAPPDKPLPLDDTLAKVERRLIELAMRLAQGNKTSAAELLAIWRPRLTRRLEQLDLDVKGDAAEGTE